MDKVKKTITTIFMLPTLKLGEDDLISNGFINAYIYDPEHEEVYDDCIYILFKPTDLVKFRGFLDKNYNKRGTNIVTDYDIEGGYVVVVFKLNPALKEDFDLIRLGQYSKTSKSFQDLFPKKKKIIRNGFTKEETSLQTRIFNKYSDLAEYWENKLDVHFTEDMEYWNGFDLDTEMLDIDKINNLLNV